mgnify:CR=1 FL=1
MKQRLPAKRTTGWTSNLLAAAGDVLVPLLFAFGVGSIFSLICGCNPFTLYSYIIKKAFFSVGGLLNTLGYTTPIIITGMATALSIRANMYNMGIEGQVFLGAFTAALAGYMIKGRSHGAACHAVPADWRRLRRGLRADSRPAEGQAARERGCYNRYAQQHCHAGHRLSDPELPWNGRCLCAH